MMFRRLTVLCAGTILAMAAPAMAQQPTFRVPIGNGAASSSSPPIYAWLESISECSSTCGSGTRTTSYQCQNAADFDYSSGGYGAPEADALCTSSVGPMPASSNSSCTNYSGCGYDWVKPPVQQTPEKISSNPIGRIGCGQVRSVFSPYCQRTGGSAAVVLPTSDHRFCRNDTPDYNQVAAGDPDALGYDRAAPQYGSCNTTDHEWRGGDGEWGTWSSTCSNSATRTRPITCYRKFDNAAVSDDKCDAGSRPASSQTQARYESCSYDWINGDDAAWGAWSSTCSSSATRTRNPQCKRSNGDIVVDSECTSRSKPKPTTSETQAVYSSCTYAAGGTTTYGAWSSQCSANAQRSVTRQCIRSNGDVVADSECTSRGTSLTSTQNQAVYDQCGYVYEPGTWSDWNSHCSASATRTRSVTCRRSDGTAVSDSECNNRGVSRPGASETQAVYDQCTYTPRDRGRSACSMQGQQEQYWDCTRQDGTTGFPAANCGKTNPEIVSCTPPYTYSPHDHGVGACESNNTRPHYWDCMRNDGQDGFPASYCGKSNPEYESCSFVSYAWATGGWSDWNSHCSGSATRTRAVWCRGTDGSTGADSQCPGARPGSSETTGVYDQCGYGRGGETGVSDWNSHCSGNAQRTHYFNCRRSDGAVVADAECTNRGIGLTSSETGQVYDQCSYNAGYGGWSACSNNQQTRSVSCTRSDGVQVDPSYCGVNAPGGTQTQSCDSTPKNGEGQCIGGTQVGVWGYSYTNSVSSGQYQSRDYPRGYNNIQFPNWCLQTKGGSCWDEHETYYVADERAGGNSGSYEMRCFVGTQQVRTGISYDASTSDGLTVDWSRWNYYLK